LPRQTRFLHQRVQGKAAFYTQPCSTHSWNLIR
jgi:hypothetical protein